MLDLSVQIDLFDQSAISQVVDLIKKYRIDNPVYIIELPECYRLLFDTDYEQWEFQQELEQLYEEHAFTTDIGKGDKAIKLTFHLVQHPSSTDNWGRPWNEAAITTTRYLVKREVNATDHNPATTFHVLFGDSMRKYTVHIAQGVYLSSQEKFYVPVKEKFTSPETALPVSNNRFESISGAFWEGYRKLSLTIEEEYQAFKKECTRKRKK